MKRIYTIIDENKEEKTTTLDYPMPFEENVNEAFKKTWGAFLKSIDHNKRTIEIYNRYDSGKGCTIIPAKKENKPTLNKIINDFMLSDKNVLGLWTKTKNWFIIKSKDSIRLLEDASIDDRGYVSGFNKGTWSVKEIAQKLAGKNIIQYGCPKEKNEKAKAEMAMLEKEREQMEERRKNYIELLSIGAFCSIENIVFLYKKEYITKIEAIELLRIKGYNLMNAVNFIKGK